MKLLLSGCGLVMLAWGALMPAAAAPTRTPAEATAHALDELANLCAQRRPECLPTLTPVPTATRTPSATSTLTPTATPEVSAAAAIATPTPEPCWFTDPDAGDPDNGFIVFDQDGAPVPCTLADQPSPTDEPTPTSEPTVASTETPVPARPAPVAASVASVPAAAVAIQPPEPLHTYTPYPTYTPLPTYTSVPTRSVTLTPSPSRTATAAPTSAPTATRTPLPIAAAPASNSSTAQQPGRWEWAAFLGYLSAAIGIAVLLVGLVTRRRVVVWKGDRTRV